nr:MAG TPA: hypothetical protein [Caudoviricetes sp.]
MIGGRGTYLVALATSQAVLYKFSRAKTQKRRNEKWN